MHEELMRVAIALSIENVRTGRGGPFAAVVAKDGALIGRGVNLVTATNDPTAHAEVSAIRAACQALGSFHLTGCELYTTCVSPAPCAWGRSIGPGWHATTTATRAQTLPESALTTPLSTKN